MGYVRQVLLYVPDFRLSHILVQVGTNDVGRARKIELFLLLGAKLGGLHELLPNTRIIWSSILPRRKYSQFCDDDQPRIDRTHLAFKKHARSRCRQMSRSEAVSWITRTSGMIARCCFAPTEFTISSWFELFLRSPFSGLAHIV